MSIIHDALKRTQTSLEQTKTPAPTNVEPPTLENEPPPLKSDPPSAAVPFAKVREPEPPRWTLPTAAAKPARSAQPLSLPSSKWPVSAIILIVIVLCLMEAVFLIISRKNNSKESTELVQQERKEKQRILKLLEQAKAAPAPEPIKGLVLNGIIMSGAEPMALINNEIVKAGDIVNGKRVVSISERKVEIFSDGEVIVLTTKR